MGEGYAALFIDAVIRGPAWHKTALFWVYDEHGGWYDHVPPQPAVKPDNVAPMLEPGDVPGAYDYTGFRVPCCVVSAWSKKDYVSHHTFDHTSILKFVETKWNLPALTFRDANAHNMLDFFDLTAKRPPFAEPPVLKAPRRTRFPARPRSPQAHHDRTRRSSTRRAPLCPPGRCHPLRPSSPPSHPCRGTHRGPAETNQRGDPDPGLKAGLWPPGSPPNAGSSRASRATPLEHCGRCAVRSPALERRAYGVATKGLVRHGIGDLLRPSGVHTGEVPEHLKQLEAAGAGAPKGRTYHVALESEGAIQVFDIWESQADFEAFGQTLIPILTELGVELKDPMVANVHNVIKG